MLFFKQYEEKSVFVNGFAEAASEKAKQGKVIYMIFCKRRKKICFFLYYLFDIISNMLILTDMILEKIAEAIKKSGKSRYQIAKDTGIDNAVLCRIVTGSGTGSCGTKTADILCKYLGLELTEKKTKK